MLNKARAQCYKTFNFSFTNMRARVFVPGRPFQLGLMFVVKARSLPQSGDPEWGFTRVCPVLDLAGKAPL
jgi:hypothetical protein